MVAALPAEQLVVTGPAEQSVVAGLAFEFVAAVVALQSVFPRAAIDVVAPVVSGDFVPAVLTVEVISAVATLIRSLSPTVRIEANLRRDGRNLTLAKTKTPTSRRVLALPPACAAAFADQRYAQDADLLAAGPEWANPHDLVFTTEVGTPLDPSNVRRGLHIVAKRAGLEGLHPHLLRHAAASLLSAAGVPLEDISDTLGHRSIAVTAEIYRHPIAPVRSGHLAAMTALTAR